MTDSCPTCGQAVAVHTGGEGTSSYVKVAEGERDLLRGLLDGRKSMTSQLIRERDEHAEDSAGWTERALAAEAQLVEAREALKETPYPDWWHKGKLGRAEQLRKFIDALLRERDQLRTRLSPPTEGSE